jgi:hypothetical protein
MESLEFPGAALFGCCPILTAPAGCLAATNWSSWALALYFLLLVLLLLALPSWPRDDDK